MKVVEFTWGVIVGETANQPKDSITELISLASRKSKGIYQGAAKHRDGRIAYSADWIVHPQDGLSIRHSFESTDAEIVRLPVLFNTPLFITRGTWEVLRRWPKLPNGSSYGLEAMSLKAYFIGVGLRCLTTAVCQHVPPPKPNLLNAHFVHRAYFSDEAYQHIWAPMLLKKGYVAEIADVLQSREMLREARHLEEHRKNAEELFFRKSLLRNFEDVFDVDREAGRAMPSNLAVYAGYEARRSPGREWGHDKGRLERHMRDLLGYLEDTDLSQLELLDIGSRDGWYLDELVRRGFTHGKVRGIDISIWVSKHARSVGRPVSYGDAHDLSRWPDGNFDVVTSWHNLEHCHSPLAVLGEIHRTLRDKGMLMIVLPVEKQGLSTAGDHCHAFRSAQHVIKVAQEAGFGCEDFTQRGSEFTGFFAKAPA